MKICPTCQTENRDEARFCRLCGGTLPDTSELVPSDFVQTRTVHAFPPGTLIHGRYRILKKIGEGGMGRVYLAEDDTGRRYALKQLRERGLQDSNYDMYLYSFQREANILSSLPHPYLPIARDFVNTPDIAFIALDYIEGHTLSEILNEAQGPLPESRVLDWMVKVCEALSYLHNKKPPIIHRNIKPKNIILEEGEGDRVRLIGFGLARFYIEGLPKDEDHLGTTGYSPPEQYGLAQTDARSDIFGVGATMFELLTAQNPAQYVDDSQVEQLKFNFPDPRCHNPKLSPQTCEVVLKALEIDPARRFQSADELKHALETILSTKPPEMYFERFVLNQPVPYEETRYYEFKEIVGAHPVRSIRKIVDEYVVAFLNREGGRIFWGIRDKDRIVVGVNLNYRQRDEVRRGIIDKINQIQPAVAPSAYQVNLHEVYDGDQPVKDLYVIEVIVPRSHANLLYFTGASEVYVKTDAGKKRLSGPEIQDEIIRRLQKGFGNYLEPQV